MSKFFVFVVEDIIETTDALRTETQDVSIREKVKEKSEELEFKFDYEFSPQKAREKILLSEEKPTVIVSDLYFEGPTNPIDTFMKLVKKHIPNIYNNIIKTAEQCKSKVLIFSLYKGYSEFVQKKLVSEEELNSIINYYRQSLKINVKQDIKDYINNAEQLVTAFLESLGIKDEEIFSKNSKYRLNISSLLKYIENLQISYLKKQVY